jgi:hypothetical protein
MRLRTLLCMASFGLLVGCENLVEPGATIADEPPPEATLAHDPLLQEVLNLLLEGTEDEQIYRDVLELMSPSKPDAAG